MTDRSEHVDIYPVGLLRDLKHFRAWRRESLQYAIGRLRRSMRMGRWRRRSYYNGYLAESSANVPRCGHGWTRRRALIDLQRAKNETAWYLHLPCGRSRLAAPENRRRRIYCVECDRRDRRINWTRTLKD